MMKTIGLIILMCAMGGCDPNKCVPEFEYLRPACKKFCKELGLSVAGDLGGPQRLRCYCYGIMSDGLGRK
jgi:hypothetical protein